jgi:hypothetical protein
MRTRRFVPLSGVAAVILIMAGSGAAGNTPKPDAPVGRLVSFYTAHDTGQVISGVLMSLAAIFFLIFSAAVVEAFRGAEVDVHLASMLSFAGALVFAAGLAIAAGFAVFIGDVATHAEPSGLEGAGSDGLRSCSQPQPPFQATCSAVCSITSASSR